MYHKIAILIVILMSGMSSIAQKSVNNYAYVIVPLKFDFLDKADQYRLNTLTKYLFKQNGFTVFFDVQDLPEALVKNRCKALDANVENLKGSLFKTKLEVVLKDCYGKEVFRSKTGSTREKNYKDAYAEALKDAFVSIEALNYSYEPLVSDVAVTAINTEGSVVIPKAVVNDVSTAKEPKSIGISDSVEPQSPSEDLYYAQVIANGYQLVDAQPKIVMTLLNTGAANVYLVKGRAAIVYKEDGFWYYSENNGVLKAPQPLNIKF